MLLRQGGLNSKTRNSEQISIRTRPGSFSFADWGAPSLGRQYSQQTFRVRTTARCHPPPGMRLDNRAPRRRSRMILHNHADPFADFTHWGSDSQAESHVFSARRIFKRAPTELGRVQIYILLVSPVF